MARQTGRLGHSPFKNDSATLAQSLASRLANRVTIYEEQLVIMAMFWQAIREGLNTEYRIWIKKRFVLLFIAYMTAPTVTDWEQLYQIGK